MAATKDAAIALRHNPMRLHRARKARGADTEGGFGVAARRKRGAFICPAARRQVAASASLFAAGQASRFEREPASGPEVIDWHTRALLRAYAEGHWEEGQKDFQKLEEKSNLRMIWCLKCMQGHADL